MPENPKPDKNERLALSLDPEEALRALLKVDPGSEPEESERAPNANKHEEKERH